MAEINDKIKKVYPMRIPKMETFSDVNDTQSYTEQFNQLIDFLNKNNIMFRSAIIDWNKVMEYLISEDYSVAQLSHVIDELKNDIEQLQSDMPNADEVVEARTDVTNQVYLTLKARLDAEQNVVLTLQQSLNNTNTELSNARTSKAGTVYPTLKDRLNSDSTVVEGIQSETNDLQLKVISLRNDVDNLFENGGGGTGGNDNSPMKERVITNYINSETNIFTLPDLDKALYYLDEVNPNNQTYALLSAIVLPENTTYFELNLCAKNEAMIAIAIDEYENGLILGKMTGTNGRICTLVYNKENDVGTWKIKGFPNYDNIQGKMVNLTTMTNPNGSIPSLDLDNHAIYYIDSSATQDVHVNDFNHYNIPENGEVTFINLITPSDEKPYYIRITGHDGLQTYAYGFIIVSQSNQAIKFKKVNGIMVLEGYAPVFSTDGWVDLPLNSGFVAYNSTSTPKYRIKAIDGEDYIEFKGAIKSVAKVGKTIPISNMDYRTFEKEINFITSMSVTGGTDEATVGKKANFVRWNIDPATSNLSILSTSLGTKNIPVDMWIQLDSPLLLMK